MFEQMEMQKHSFDRIVRPNMYDTTRFHSRPQKLLISKTVHTWPGESSARKARSSSLRMNLRLLLAQVDTSTLVLWWPWRFWSTNLLFGVRHKLRLTNQLPIDLSCLPQLFKAVLVKQGETPCSRLRRKIALCVSRSCQFYNSTAPTLKGDLNFP